MDDVQIIDDNEDQDGLIRLENQEPDVLVVDLDDTLVRTDMLYESFWASFAKDCTLPFRAISAFMRGGKAGLKLLLSNAADLDVSTLPYNELVLNYIKAWRDSGGTVALVTATDQYLAKQISNHLGLFDDVYGSNGTTNLKGKTKADFLAEKYGENKFTYIGDSHADLEVWKIARKAVVVDPSERLKARVKEVVQKSDILQSEPRQGADYLLALRPHQWIKNMLIFVPVLTSHQLVGYTLGQSALAFFAFSMVASSVYVLNDLLDLSADRLHPSKRHRPIAAGKVRIIYGLPLVIVPVLIGLMAAAVLGTAFLAVMALYYLMTTAYSLSFKRKPIIDICTLAGLYTVRILAGSAATGIHLSVWLLAFSVFFFFALAAIKRQAELVDCKKRDSRFAAGRAYVTDDIPLVSQIAAAAGFVSVLVMSLYLNSTAVLELYTHPEVLWGVCGILMYWISRVLLITHRGNMHDDPIVFAVKDKTSWICAVLIVAVAIAAKVM